MRRSLVVAAFAVAVAVPVSSVTATADQKPLPNCHGLWLSWAAQLDSGVADAAAAAGVTVQEAQQVIRAFCDAVNS